MDEEITIQIVKSNTPCGCLICPNCNAHELVDCNEKDTNKWRYNIRAFKVDNSSHCLKCDKWFTLEEM